MTRSIFAIYDHVSQEFVGPLLLFPGSAAASRVFVDSLSDPSSKLASHPGDYSLFHVGSFNHVSGSIEVVDDVLHQTPVLRGSEWVASQPPKPKQEDMFHA